jgi:hypothetical protein
MRSFVTGLLAAVVVCVLGAAPVEAQTHVGIRAGVSADPDQFFFGGHIETRPLIERLTFRPNVELGIGDDLTVFTGNLEFVYSVPLRQPWRVYFGAGPALVVFSRDDDGPGNDDNDGAGGGFNILLGAQHSGGLFGELKIGLVDSPELKVTIGYAFR